MSIVTSLRELGKEYKLKRKKEWKARFAHPHCKRSQIMRSQALGQVIPYRADRLERIMERMVK